MDHHNKSGEGGHKVIRLTLVWSLWPSRLRFCGFESGAMNCWLPHRQLTRWSCNLAMKKQVFLKVILRWFSNTSWDSQLPARLDKRRVSISDLCYFFHIGSELLPAAAKLSPIYMSNRSLGRAQDLLYTGILMNMNVHNSHTHYTVILIYTYIDVLTHIPIYIYMYIYIHIYLHTFTYTYTYFYILIMHTYYAYLIILIYIYIYIYW